MPEIKFVILSESRSGTSLLSGTLGSHPEILCHGEIYHEKTEWHLLGNFAGMTKEEIQALRENEDDFVERVFNQDGYKAVGFKMWRNQNPAVCKSLLNDDSILKIIYERDNKLAQFSSGILANKTGIWNLTSGANVEKIIEPKKTQIAFNAEAFNKFIEFQKNIFDFYLENVSGSFIKLTYSEIVLEGYSRVLEFLGVKPMELQPAKAKLYSSDILSRFAADDRAKILETLEAIGHSEWAFE